MSSVVFASGRFISPDLHFEGGDELPIINLLRDKENLHSRHRLGRNKRARGSANVNGVDITAIS